MRGRYSSKPCFNTITYINFEVFRIRRINHEPEHSSPGRTRSLPCISDSTPAPFSTDPASSAPSDDEGCAGHVRRGLGTLRSDAASTPNPKPRSRKTPQTQTKLNLYSPILSRPAAPNPFQSWREVPKHRNLSRQASITRILWSLGVGVLALRSYL